MTSETGIARSDILRHLVLRPDDADGWFLLGATGGNAAALHRALAAQPAHIDAALALSQVAPDLAQRLLRRALVLDPGRAAVTGTLALLALGQGAAAVAIALLRRILWNNPADAITWVNLGKAEEAAGDTVPASRSWRRAAALEPAFAAAQLNLGIADLVRHASRAVSRLRRAAFLTPGDPEIWNNLGDGLRRLGALDAAVTCARRSLAILPAHEGFHRTLSNCLLEFPHLPAAEEAARRALSIAPGSAADHYNHAVLLLTAGRIGEGRLEYEWRWRVPGLCRSPSEAPRWTGADNPKATLLVHAEQGLGDVLQFARYIPAASECVTRVVLAVPASVIRLLQAAFPAVTVVNDALPLPPHDLAIPIMSLPLALGTDAAAADYLPHPPAAALPPDPRPTVGLVWAGNPGQARDEQRSASLDALAPMLSMPSIRWLSLQFGAKAADVASANLLDLGERLGDFAETARFVAATDLVITVDTAMAHLAGALGHPVWTLLAKVPDWRWGLEGEETAWYPSMRLWRQQRRGDWRELAGRVATALGRLERRL